MMMRLPKISALNLTRSPKKPKKRQYAAAQYTSMTGDWRPGDGNVNDEIGSSYELLRARIRQLVRDNPHFQRAVNIFSSFVCGSGIKYQSQIRDKNGERLKDLNQYIEDKFERWLDHMDYAGRLHGFEFQDLSCRQLSECGEFLLIRRLDRSGFEMPLRYQAIEPDNLASYLAVDNRSSGNETAYGVEYNKQTMRRIRYHFYTELGESFSIAADQIIHGFHTLRPGQLRGVSDYASGVLLADAFQNYTGSELARKAMAAKYLGIVKSPDPLRLQQGLGQDSDTNTKLEDVEEAMFRYLNPMEDITFPTPPSDMGIKEFSELMLQMYSVATGIPYEILTQNYGGMSFSTAKIKRSDFENEFAPIVSRFCRWHCEPIKRDFFRFGTLSGYLDLPGFDKDPDFYMRGAWQVPGREPVNPLQDVKAVIEEVKARLRSPQEYIRSRGADPQEVLAEIAEYKQLAEAAGLDFDQALAGISTMNQQNPAKVEADMGTE